MTLVFIVVSLIILIVARTFVPDRPKLKWNDNLQNRVETFGVEAGDKLDLVLLEERHEVHIYAKGITEEYGKLAVCRDEKIYKKVKEGKMYAQVTVIAIGGMRIEFFNKD